jgi:hypothetical protein
MDLPSIAGLIGYYHAAAGAPVKSTWLAAIKAGNYASWPGLSYALAAKYCPCPDATLKGHMAQSRQHVRSTQPRPDCTLPPDHAASPTPESNVVHLCELPLSRLYTDDTGRFPIRAQSGNQYIMVAYHTMSNAILIQPFTTKHDRHRLAAADTIMTRLQRRQLPVDTIILDNEASADYRRNITDKWHCTYQLVPPDMHRRNAAERAIRTFKAHFIAILAGIDTAFPANRWDLLLPHAELTVNLLRQSRAQPAISAWEHLAGPFNFDATPLGPPGCRVILHAKPATRRSWDFRGSDGFYIGPALSHYRCYTLLKRDTRAVVVSDTVRFRHPTMAVPTVTPEDRLFHCLHALTNAVRHSSNKGADDQLKAIEDLRAICRQLAPPSATPTSTPKPATNAHPPPRVATMPSCNTHPTPRVATMDSPPDHSWTPVARARRSTAAPTQPSEPLQPIALRTRSHLHGNAFSALAADDDGDDDNDDDKPIVTSLLQANPNSNLALPVLDQDTGQTLEHRQLRRHPKYKDVWDTSYADELGRLCQGIGQHPTRPSQQRVAGTDTFRPIQHADIPAARRHEVTYTKVVCEVRPQKDDPNRTRITIGGNRICYPGDTGTKTGSLEVVKLLFNSVLSRPSAKFASFDIKNFYLGTPLDRPEYVRIKLTDIPAEFITEYDLHAFVHDGWIYFEITKAVYGLKQAGKLANDLLTDRLGAHGYFQTATTPGLWRHNWRSIMFILIVDDFGIEFCEQRHADHLLAALQSHYTVTTDWTGAKFAGIDITWDYARRTCRLLMPGSIHDIRLKYGHTAPSKPQHAPHKHREIVYGAKIQLSPEDDTSAPLDAAGIKRIQGIIGSLLYYARAVDNKLLMTLSSLGAQQAAATENTRTAIDQLLDYVATYPSDGTTYRASNMILAAHSDASFLSESKSRSRAGASIFLTENDPIPRLNGPVLTISQIVKFVMASAAEAELSALFITAREMVPLRNTLIEMGWPQPPSPIQTDNSTAVGFTNDTIIARRIKMLCLRLHWLRCRESQGQFRFYWDKGTNNIADYHTKHHPPAYHLAHRATHAG